MELDRIDRMILARMQEDARQSAEAVGAALGVSATVVQRRLKRLRAAGVIRRETVELDPKALGLAMSFVVAVELEREQADIIDSFRRSALASPHVQQCFYVTGEADFFLVMHARDMEDFEAQAQKLFLSDARVRRFRTSVVIKPVKTGQALPLLD